MSLCNSVLGGLHMSRHIIPVQLSTGWSAYASGMGQAEFQQQALQNQAQEQVVAASASMNSLSIHVGVHSMPICQPRRPAYSAAEAPYANTDCLPYRGLLVLMSLVWTLRASPSGYLALHQCTFYSNCNPILPQQGEGMASALRSF